ncbi:BZ3500_MvSof-1268-A1-R1_Chr5-2g08017 [Microbotryum saponariae]|uniref:BZ3500_MvSof-1268-A1-R1_Chr5-2g08017 protein n=1 Tax=Microbotryum saponariae TaxID=289078 RepID=A0A2X0KH24_9BASI|nr:BZ3500_MvSof-1268-A1-R1_Chr5-2g08017 [Microbotryum saponariae]SDA05886.1 BZ3501_MvSof-1269-A2-R1_Chr5-2g07839 [Microbotryum saponariae]
MAKGKTKHSLPTDSSTEMSSQASKKEMKRLKKLQRREQDNGLVDDGHGASGPGSMMEEAQGIMDVEVGKEGKKMKEDKGKKRKRGQEGIDQTEEEPLGRTSNDANRAHKDQGREEPHAAASDVSPTGSSSFQNHADDLPNQSVGQRHQPTTSANSDSNGIGLDRDVNQEHQAEESESKRRKKDKKSSKNAKTTSLESTEDAPPEEADDDPKARNKAVKKAEKERKRVAAAEPQTRQALQDRDQQQQLQEEAIDEGPSVDKQGKKDGEQKKMKGRGNGNAFEERPSETAGTSKASVTTASETRPVSSHFKKKGTRQEATTSKQAAAPAKARKAHEVDVDGSDSDADIDVETLIQSLMVARPKSSSKAKAATSDKAPKSTPTGGEEGRKVQKDKGKQKALPRSSPGRDGDDKEASIAAFEGMEPMELLRSKWLTAPQLELVKKANPGFWYNSGRFTRTEEEQIRQAVEKYRSAHGLTEAEMIIIITTPRNKKQTDVNIRELLEGHEEFWPEIAASVDRRSLLSIYNYVKRKYNPLARAGPWTEEQDAALRRAYQEHGSNWQQVGDEVGRAAFDCQDRYQKQLLMKSERKTGAWTNDETDRLRQAVAKHGSNNWSVVAKIVGQRTPAQCRTKWNDGVALRNPSPKLDRLLTLPEHRSNLVHALKDLKVKDESEIQSWDFDDPTLKQHSAKTLHDRWTRLLKRALKALKREDDRKDYSYADKVRWLLNRYPEPGVHLRYREWLKTKEGIAAKSRIKTNTKKHRRTPSKKQPLSQAFVDSSDDDTESESESEKDEEEEDNELA